MRRAEVREADWGRYNFLENLLVHGLMPSRGVPAESGVQFYIDSAIREEGLCLVFKTDWGGRNPLVPDTEVKPDYLVLFIGFDGAPWRVTLIEMKGSEGKNLRHGVDQILSFHQKYRRAFEESLPPWIKLQWQGLLLHAPNADVPRNEIANTLHGPCRVRAVAGHHQTDLYPFVRAWVSPSQPAPHHKGQNHQAPHCFNALEQAIAGAERHHRGGPTVGGISLRLDNQDYKLCLDLAREPARAVLQSDRPAPDLCTALRSFPEDCRRRWLFSIPGCEWLAYP